MSADWLNVGVWLDEQDHNHHSLKITYMYMEVWGWWQNLTQNKKRHTVLPLLVPQVLWKLLQWDAHYVDIKCQNERKKIISLQHFNSPFP